jgi:hypothetical protein
MNALVENTYGMQKKYFSPKQLEKLAYNINTELK